MKWGPASSTFEYNVESALFKLFLAFRIELFAKVGEASLNFGEERIAFLLHKNLDGPLDVCICVEHAKILDFMSFQLLQSVEFLSKEPYFLERIRFLQAESNVTD